MAWGEGATTLDGVNAQSVNVRYIRPPSNLGTIDVQTGTTIWLDGVTLTGGTTGVVINSAGYKLGFFGATPVDKPTGVAVSSASIHAALVSLGLIAA